MFPVAETFSLNVLKDLICCHWTFWMMSSDWWKQIQNFYWSNKFCFQHFVCWRWQGKTTMTDCSQLHDDVIKWKHFPHHWPFVQGIHRSLVNSQHKGQWHGPLMLSLICTLDKRLSTQSWGWWYEMPSHSLWHHFNVDHPFNLNNFNSEFAIHTVSHRISFSSWNLLKHYRYLKHIWNDIRFIQQELCVIKSLKFSETWQTNVSKVMYILLSIMQKI